MQAVHHIYQVRSLLSDILKTKNCTRVEDQLQVVQEVVSSIIEFDSMKVMLYDGFLQGFFEVVRSVA
jgi:hypothetical protein